MGVLTTGNTFSTGDQVTASKLNAAVNSSTFQPDAVDNITTQLISVGGVSNSKIVVKDLGITQDKIASDAVGTNQLANDVVISTSGSITTTSGFTGSVTGNLTGNITGNVTGGTGSFTTLAASGDVTFDTTTLKVDSSNNRVGIGTASPSEELEVSATGVGLLVRNSDANQEAGIATVRGQRSDTNTSPASAGGISLESWNTSGATVVNEHLGSVYFGANHTSGSESNILGTASIAGIAEGTFSDSSTMPSAIAFRTGSAGQAIGVYNQFVGEAERMRIGSDGNVGIGTTDPVERLQVVGNVRIGDGAGVLDDLVLKGSDGIGPSSVGGSTSAAIITTNGTPTGSGHVGIEVPSNDNDDGFYVATDPNQTGTADLLALKINALGNVGIGETAPSAPLTVTSTTGGVILPRMTTSNRTSISSPANGEMVYDTDLNKFYGYANGSWVAFH